jgi:hypothetical protein
MFRAYGTRLLVLGVYAGLKSSAIICFEPTPLFSRGHMLANGFFNLLGLFLIGSMFLMELPPRGVASFHIIATDFNPLLRVPG